MSVRILIGDVRDRLADIPADSVDCVVTSPPYWGLRDYGIDGQLGLERTFAEHVATIADVFDEVRRVLSPRGTLWLNYGDSYATGAGKVGERPGGGAQGDAWNGHRGSRGGSPKQPHTGAAVGPLTQPNRMPQPGLKPKDLCGIPWRVAFALQERGWWLRQDIIWSKPNPMPESIKDRCTKAHEYLFLMSKSERYHFDQEAILEPISAASVARLSQPTLDEQAGSDRVPGKTNGSMKAVGRRPKAWDEDMGSNRTLVAGYARKSGNKERKPGSARGCPEGSGSNVCGSVPWEGSKRNRRSVWTVPTQPFSEAHFATFPPELIEPCILAGCPVGGTVLDPFFGAGTTGLVADRLGRDCIGIELNPEYAELARSRIEGDAGLFAEVA